MSAELMPFDNGEFRLDIEPHAADGFRVSAEQLARALSTRGRDLVRSVPDAEKGRALVRTPGGTQESWYLTEAGFYRAIGQRQTGRIEDPSIRAQVQRFQAWVFGTVLPSIRRGAQSTATLPDRKALARMVIESEEARELAEARAEEGAKFKRAIEGGDGLGLREFHKKYFSAINETTFMDHLYAKNYLIDQRGKGTLRTSGPRAGTYRDGSQHRHPSYKGKQWFYLHGSKDRADVRRENTHVRPGPYELALRDRLAAEGLPANEDTNGLFVIEGGNSQGELG